MPHSSLVVANQFLGLAQEENCPLTHMQVQKLVYLAHGWHLALMGAPLVEEPFEAWEYGPVNRRLYDALRQYGRQAIARLIRWGDDTPFPGDDDGIAQEEMANHETAIINEVWRLYGKFPAFKLSALTHQEGSPWANAYRGRGTNPIIPQAAITEYFERLSAEPERA